MELGEIEHQLRAHPGVRDAVVVLRGSDVDVHIAAHVIPENGLSSQAVLAHARGSQ